MPFAVWIDAPQATAPERAAIVSACNLSRSVGQCVGTEGDGTDRVRVQVQWDDDVATITVFVANRAATTKQLQFEASDPAPERLETIGLTAGALADQYPPPERSEKKATPTPSTSAPKYNAKKVRRSERPTLRERRFGWATLGVTAGPSAPGASPRLGVALGVALRVSAPWFAGLQASFEQSGRIEGIRLRWARVRGPVGAVVEPGRWSFALDVGPTLHVIAADAAVVDGSAASARAVFGGGAQLTGAYQIAPGLSPYLGLDGYWLLGSTRIHVEGRQRLEVPAVGGVATVGVRYDF